MRLSRAVDLWMGELARAGRTESSRQATSGICNKFVSQVEKRKLSDVVWAGRDDE